MDFTELYRKTKFQTKTENEFSFGGSYEFEIDPSNFDYVSNFVLQIEFGALNDTANNDYYSWVDSIGHAFIEGITLKIGTHEIYNDNFPYGLWLDIYNELNDATRKEWALIGKNASINALKVKVTSKKIYQVPLHLPIGGNSYKIKVADMLPLYLLNDNNKIKLKFKTRAFNKLMLFSPNTIQNTPPTAKITLLYDTYKYKDSNTRANKKEQYSLNPFTKYYTIMSRQQKSVSQTADIEFTEFKNKTISDLIFVFQHNNRNNLDITPAVNENISDTNGNDWFNYTSDKSNDDYGFTDPINKVTKIYFNGDDQFDDNIESLYFRNVLTIMYYLNKPNKHIYVYPMKKHRFSSKGLVTIKDNIVFNFEKNMTTPTNFTMNLFGSVIKKLSIIENSVRFSDIDLETEKLLDTNLALMDSSGSLVRRGGLSENDIIELKSDIKSELFLQIQTGTLTGEVDFSAGETDPIPEYDQQQSNDNEKTTIAKQIVVKFNTFRFPSPVTLPYYLNILLYNTNPYKFFLVFNNEKYDESSLLKHFNNKKKELKESILILENLIKNREYKLTLISEGSGEPTTTVSVLKTFSFEEYIEYMTGKDLDTLIKNNKNILEQISDDNEEDILEIEKQLNLFQKIKDYNENEENVKKGNDASQQNDLFNYRYRYKKYLSIKNSFFRIKNTLAISNTTNKETIDNIKNKLKIFFTTIYDSNVPQTKNLKYNYISNILYNLFSTPYNELIADKGRFEENIEKFINLNFNRLKVINIEFPNKDVESDVEQENGNILAKDIIKNNIKFTDGLQIEYTLNSNKNKILLLLSEIKYTSFDIKKNIIKRLNIDYKEQSIR